MSEYTVIWKDFTTFDSAEEAWESPAMLFADTRPVRVVKIEDVPKPEPRIYGLLHNAGLMTETEARGYMCKYPDDSVLVQVVVDVE